MHVHRLLKRLIEPQVSDYLLCDYKKGSWFSQLNKIIKSDVMHVHVSNPYLKLFYVVAGRILGTKSLITVHGRYGIYGTWKNCIHKLALKWCDIPILINKESFKEVNAFNARAIFIPAFIPPIEGEETLPMALEEQLRVIKSDNKPLFITNASRRAFSDDGKEIYGISFLVDYFKKHSDFNLIILDPSNEYRPLLEDSLPENIVVFSEKYSFCGLIKWADVIIRNTPMDGDSFSVKEALFLHKPVLATDTVSRPEGVTLYKYNDLNSFVNGVKTVLANKGRVSLNEPDTIEEYNKLYVRMGIIPT